MNFYLKNIIGLTVFIVSSLLYVHGDTVKKTTPPAATTPGKADKTSKKTSANILNELKQYLAPVNTFQANFVQTTKNDKGQKIQTSHGSLQMKRPTFFRWEITTPFPQLYITNGSKLWVYDKALQQVTIQAVDKQFDIIPAAILNGKTDELARLYSVDVTGSKSRTFILTPKEKSSIFKVLRLIFSGKKLSGMFMSDYLGTQTHIEFLKIKENAAIADKIFSFIPPKNVDVLDETKK